MNRLKKGNSILYIISILSILIIFFGIRNAGTFLVVEDKPESADAIVVLMGSPGDRMLQAYDLFNAGYSEKVIMVDTYITGRDALAERGVYLKTNTGLAEEVGVALGIPEDAVIIIPGEAQSTGQEAVAVRNFIESGNDIKGIILVTSPSHTRRARAVFRRAFSELDHPVDIMVVPSRYSDFNAGRWYSERQSAKRVVMEYTRLLWFWAWERWRM
ncbi:MAG: YdcF family protein [bacterium]